MTTEYVDFKPKWPKDSSFVLPDVPMTGSEPPYEPRLPTRLLPSDGGNRISVNTLTDTAKITQRVLQYVGHDLAHGTHIGFSDLRTLDSQVALLAAMKIEPFEEGSFVIPAVLSEKPIQIGEKTFNGRNVLERFSEIMAMIEESKNPKTSIGLLQSVHELGRIVRREAEIEYWPSWSSSFSRIRVNERFLKNAAEAKESLRGVSIIPDQVEGRLVGLDIVKGTLRITWSQDNRMTVSGTFEDLMQPILMSSLGENVRLWGVIEFRRRKPHHIRTFTVERIEDNHSSEPV